MKENFFYKNIKKTPEYLFGFDNKNTKKLFNNKKIDNKPIKPFEINQLIEKLLKLGTINNKHPNLALDNQIIYGNDVGAFSVNITSPGPYRINIRRQLFDLSGEKIWILYKVFVLSDKDRKKNNYEINIDEYVEKIYQYLKQIDDNGLEAPTNNFDDFKYLAIKLINKLKSNTPKIFSYLGIKKNSKNYYEVHFEYAGSGIGISTGYRGENFSIHIVYYPNRGLIRCFNQKVISSVAKRNYIIYPSDWDEYFVPTQSENLIIENIKDIFKNYHIDENED